MTLEVTDDRTTIPNDSAVHCRRISSIAKNTPGQRGVEGRGDTARGPARHQQAHPLLIETAELRQRRPPAPDPICTIGPSRPTDPPPPMHSALARAFTTATCGRIRPPLRATATITSGTPCPRALPGEPVHQRTVERAGHDRGQHHEPAAEAGQVRVRRVPGGGVVGVAR